MPSAELFNRRTAGAHNHLSSNRGQLLECFLIFLTSAANSIMILYLSQHSCDKHGNPVLSTLTIALVGAHASTPIETFANFIVAGYPYLHEPPIMKLSDVVVLYDSPDALAKNRFCVRE